MSAVKLKPCPFCEGEAILEIFDYVWARVRCKKCGAIGAGFINPRKAAEAWNTRKPMERIVEQLEEKAFVDIVEEYTDHKCIIELEDAIEIVKAGGVDEKA